MFLIKVLQVFAFQVEILQFHSNIKFLIMDLKKFIYLQTLATNPTQKALFLLGKVHGQQHLGQAILIINPKLPQLQQQSLQTFSPDPIFPFTQIQTIFKNDIYSKYQVKFENSFQIQSIFPITQKQKKKYQKTIKLIQNESAKDYEEKKDALLKDQLSHIDWVKNILDGKAEQQRVLYNDNDIVLLPDFKFHNLKQTPNLHLLCIFKDLHLHSIRDLTSSHLPLLKRVQTLLTQQLQKHFTFSPTQNISIENCRVYFHYPPTFYQLHLHIQALALDTRGCNVERCHQLSTVIGNLELIGDYYQRVGLNCFKEQAVQLSSQAK